MGHASEQLLLRLGMPLICSVIGALTLSSSVLSSAVIKNRPSGETRIVVARCLYLRRSRSS